MNNKSIQNVKSLYNRYPYPNYPVWFFPRWQDATLGSSLFSAKIAQLHSPEESFGVQTNSQPNILIAGCGDTQPLIFHKFEPFSHKLNFVDLSDKNISRAKTKLFASSYMHNWHSTELLEYLNSTSKRFHHIDAFGVIHHMEDPPLVISSLSKSMAPGGTIRIMVYNTPARSWIHHLQKIFSLLKINDVVTAQSILNKLRNQIPQLADNLSQLGESTINNPSRFADTFLHPREARIGISKWFRWLNQAGLIPIGIFDRYAELDFLQNPLVSLPDPNLLEQLSETGVFSGNFEIYAHKHREIKSKKTGKTYPFNFANLAKRPPPAWWFQYEETRNTPILTRIQTWWQFLGQVALNHSASDPILDSSHKRLARVGALLSPFSSQIHSPIESFCPVHTGKKASVPKNLYAFLSDTFHNVDEKKLRVINDRLTAI